MLFYFFVNLIKNSRVLDYFLGLHRLIFVGPFFQTLSEHLRNPQPPSKYPYVLILTFSVRQQTHPPFLCFMSGYCNQTQYYALPIGWSGISKGSVTEVPKRSEAF